MVRALRLATGLGQNGVIMAEAEVANAPRPPLPYFTLKLVGLGSRFGDDVLEQVGEADEVDGTIDQNLGGPRGLLVSFNAFGRSHEEAAELMALWQASLDTDDTQALLRAVGVAVWRPGAIQDLSALLEAGFEGRAQMDCTFGVASNLEVRSAAFIKQVEVVGPGIDAVFPEDLGASGSSGSLQFDATCGTDDAVGDCVYVSGPNTVARTDIIGPLHVPVVGIIIFKASDTRCTVLMEGVFSGYSGLTRGLVYFAGPTARPESYPFASTPATLYFVQELGVALSDSTMLVRPSPLIARLLP